MDFLRSPRSKTPPLEGVLDFLRSPRSKTPPLEGGLGLSEKSKVQDPPLGGPLWTEDTAAHRDDKQKIALNALELAFVLATAGLLALGHSCTRSRERAL